MTQPLELRVHDLERDHQRLGSLVRATRRDVAHNTRHVIRLDKDLAVTKARLAIYTSLAAAAGAAAGTFLLELATRVIWP